MLLGADSDVRRSFWFAFVVIAVVAGVIDFSHVITIQHDRPRLGLLEPSILEGSSWLSLLAFFWIFYVFWQLAPLGVRPRWRLLLHIPGTAIFSLAHVGGFIALRSFAYWLQGSRYHFGPFWPQFLYELGKDALTYALFFAGFALIGHLLRQHQSAAPSIQASTFDIRDGAKLTRVPLADILAVASAGNYVEFALADGRKLLMRRPLSAIESDLAGRGFVRTHRSWLVNQAAVTGLSPEGSGDYDVSLGSLNVPLSRRFPDALARLRAGSPS